MMTAINKELHDRYIEYLIKHKQDVDVLDYPHWLEALRNAVDDQLQEIDHPREHNAPLLELETALL